MQNIFTILGPAQLAPIIGVSRQRVSWMTRHLDDGDNRERLKTAVLKIREEIDQFLAAQ